MKHEREQVTADVYSARGIYADPFGNVSAQQLGIFSSKKKARKAIERAVGHKLQWRADPLMSEIIHTEDVIGFSSITIYPEFINSTFAADYRIKTIMEESMRANESTAPIDSFLRGLTDS